MMMLKEAMQPDAVKLTQPLRILLLEDSPTDAELNERMLRRAGIDFVALRVEDHATFVAALDTFRPDIILADYSLPGFDGLQALSIVRERSPDLPCIFVTGALGEERAVEAIKQGANDYLLKDRLARLPAAVLHALKEKEKEGLRRQDEEKILATQAELQRMLAEANQSRRAMLSVIEDQRRAESATRHANRALATLSAVNRTLVRASSEDELLQSICQAIVGQRGYWLAWVGYVQHDASQSIRIMARAGHDEGYLDDLQITWAENERGMGPSGRAVRSGTTQLCQDIAHDPNFLPWRDAALQRGYAASIALPMLNGDHTVFGILSVYAEEVNAFSPAEVDLLEEMAGDLAFGVGTLHTRHERDLALEQSEQYMAQLQDSLEGTVRAIAAIVEMRDPYTAGHQARVSGLAAAIARKMGLPEDQIHAIHLAGMVHDLGKIRIPAEILSKPGKITDIEFSLIKVHPQAGYDILKDIAFPWPIAQMVLQHHERLDGSGYPQGIKGDQIDLGARILCVADVVEAISSHRPYRPALGIDAALNEITRGRGTSYDAQVADACMALFREQGYLFTD
ncbi:MAG: GAF domain-containing protein [Gallionella sp.]|nr:GAF domain-containing protein [Gallionella sp.]